MREAADRKVRGGRARRASWRRSCRRRRPGPSSRATARRARRSRRRARSPCASFSVRRPVTFAARARRLDVLRIDEEQVRAEAVDLAADALRRAARERGHDDDRRDADEDAEHRERRAQLVADDRRERETNRAEDEREPSRVAPGAGSFFRLRRAATRAATRATARGSARARSSRDRAA